MMSKFFGDSKDEGMDSDQSIIEACRSSSNSSDCVIKPNVNEDRVYE